VITARHRHRGPTVRRGEVGPGSLRAVERSHQEMQRRVDRRATAAGGLVAALVIALGTTAMAGAVAAQDDPDPTTPTTEAPQPTTTPTTSPPTTETPTTLPPTTVAPEPTVPPTTSGGGGGGGVRPTAPTTAVPTTEAPVISTTAPGPTLLAPTPGAVTVPPVTPDAAEEGRVGPWLQPETQLRVAVGGLVALALVMVALTIAYWRHTRPGSATSLVGVAGGEGGTSDGDDGATGGTPGGPAGSVVSDGPVDEAVPSRVEPPAAAAEPVGAGFSAAPPSALPPPTLAGGRDGPSPVPTAASDHDD